MNKDTSINIKCGKALKEAVTERANKEGMTFSDFVRWVLRSSCKEPVSLSSSEANKDNQDTN